jgi:hypothetical protein
LVQDENKVPVKPTTINLGSIESSDPLLGKDTSQKVPQLQIKGHISHSGPRRCHETAKTYNTPNAMDSKYIHSVVILEDKLEPCGEVAANPRHNAKNET